jgi:hypothetical protein
VLKGIAGPQLLATYNTERQPIGELAMQQAYTRYVLRVVPERGKEGMQPLVDDLSMEIGYRYRSPAIVAETGSGASLYEDPRKSKAMPGTRAPHVMLRRAGKPISTLDLFTKNFCVLAAPGGGALPPARPQPISGSPSMHANWTTAMSVTRTDVSPAPMACRLPAPSSFGPTVLSPGVRPAPRRQARRQ